VYCGILCFSSIDARAEARFRAPFPKGSVFVELSSPEEAKAMIQKELKYKDTPLVMMMM